MRVGVWRFPLPELDGWRNRLLLRLVCALALRQVRSFEGLERLLPAADPFVLAINHGSRREAAFLPALLMLARGGRPVHFLADWSFRLIPGVDALYRRTGAISVFRKPARPAFLNRFKDRFHEPGSALERAKARLGEGSPVAIFPEGTVNRDARRRLRPRPGAVRLALGSGVPLIPLGVRYVRLRSDGRTKDSGGPMEIRVGAPAPLPSLAEGAAGSAEIRRLGADLMDAIAGLCHGTEP